jgi:hypothetical protein
LSLRIIDKWGISQPELLMENINGEYGNAIIAME